MTLAPGTTVGRYQILEPLGQGGMATVYKAFQPSLQREVALKVLRPGYAQDAEFRERFEREAIAIARLRHPHIVQVFDFEIAEGQFFLAMEFLDGGTLKDRLTAVADEGRGLDPNEAVRIIWEVADALSYAHDAGVIHRDVKPSNVMLAKPRDRAVVTDFGIARILGGTSHTQTGVGIGTPEYMAPEQGQGGAIDHRADIYSLGAMAYEIFTGRVPYSADTPLAVVLAHIKDPLPLPSKVNPTIGPSLERALLKALAKDPAQRFDTAISFAEAVRDGLARDAAGGTLPTIVVHGGAAPAVTARAETAVATTKLAPTRPTLLIGGAAAAILLLGGGALVAGVLGGRSETRPEPTAAASVVAATASPPLVSSTPLATVVPSPAAAPATTAPASTPTVAPTATAAPTAAVTQQSVPTAAPATVAPVAVTTPQPATTATSVATAAPTATLAPTPIPTPAPTPSPTPAPAVPKGALVYEAKLDGTSGDTRSAVVSDPSKAAVSYSPGAIQLALLADGGRIDFTFNAPSLQNFVGELDLSVSPGSNAVIEWRLRKDPTSTYSYEVNIGTRSQFADIVYKDLSVAVQRNPRTTLGSAPVPGLQTEPVVTVAVVVDGSRIAFFVAGRRAVEVTDTRVTGPAVPRITLDRGPGATVRIVGARYYALP